MANKAPKTATQRYDNYTRKIDPTHFHDLLTVLKPGMHDNLETVLGDLESVYTAVQTVLSTETGVTVFLATGYQNFARQIWYAKNAHTGTELESEVTAISGDWEDRGLNPAILVRIVTEVFALEAPGNFDAHIWLTGSPTDATYVITPGLDGTPKTGTLPISNGQLDSGAQHIVCSKALYKDWIADITFPSAGSVHMVATLKLA